MDAWIWMAVGTALLAIELTLIDAQFYLVFLGVSAMAVGLVRFAGLDLPPWAQWLLFAALGIVLLFGFRRRMYAQLRSHLPTMQSAPAGEFVTLPEDLPPGADCRIELQGTVWTAQNGGPAPLPKGARVRIARVDGLTLVLGPAE